MKRRDLIKAGFLISALGLISGCNKSYEDSLNIKPKQTDVYKISTPLPFDFKLIDEISELNKSLKKSKITTLYNALPYPCTKPLDEEFHNKVGLNEQIKSLDDFSKYVKYAQDSGFHFVYLLNSPKPFNKKTFNKYAKALFNLTEKLNNIGVKEIKVANIQLMKILEEKTDFDFSCSTSFEYHNVSQFKNLFETNKRIKTIDIAIDDNRNFLYLKNLKKMLPNINIEIIVNELCIHGCPGRIVHPVTEFFRWPCYKLIEKMGPIKYFCKGNMIYPWNLEYYSALNINNFKFLEMPQQRADIKNIIWLKNYFLCVEKGIENISADEFFNGIFSVGYRINPDIKLSEIIKYLPDIRHFIKHGDKCANICDITCDYCLKCAEKLEKALKINYQNG